MLDELNCRHMPIALVHERGNVFRLDIRGTLLKKDLDRCQETLTGEISRVGPVRLLVVLTNFEGWEPGAPWHDLTFFVRHGDKVERIAIIGDENWRSEALMFAGADLRKGPVEYFSAQAAPAARAWLSA
jgi:hypothetical protein